MLERACLLKPSLSGKATFILYEKKFVSKTFSEMEILKVFLESCGQPKKNLKTEVGFFNIRGGGVML